MATLNLMEHVSERIAENAINLETTIFKLQLYTAATAPVSTSISDAGLTEVTAATGYTAGGITLTGVTTTRSGAVTTWDADDVVFASVTSGGFTGARYAIITAAGGWAIAWVDLGADKTNNNTELTIAFDAAGILTIG